MYTHAHTQTHMIRRQGVGCALFPLNKWKTLNQKMAEAFAQMAIASQGQVWNNSFLVIL